jgi:hypothetical protein
MSNISHLLASEFDLLKNHLFSKEFVNACWDLTFREPYQKDLESDAGAEIVPCGITAC